MGKVVESEGSSGLFSPGGDIPPQPELGFSMGRLSACPPEGDQREQNPFFFMHSVSDLDVTVPIGAGYRPSGAL